MNIFENDEINPTFDVVYKLIVNDTNFGNNNSTAYIIDDTHYILITEGESLGNIIRAFKFNTPEPKKP